MNVACTMLYYYEPTFMNRLLLSESSVQKSLNFLLVQRLQKKISSASEIELSSQRKYLAACGDRTCGFTASIMRVFAPVMLGAISGGEDAGPNISPGAVVERLFLYVPTCQSCGWGNFAHDRT
jgi:hypothetical protein